MGVAHPDYLPLTSSQINDWHAFYSLEPWGFRAEWNKFAMLAMVTANTHRMSKEAPIAELSDFMPDESLITGPKKQSLEDQKFMIDVFLARAKKNPKIKVVERKRKK